MNNENMIDFLTGGDGCMTVSFTSRRHITKIKKLYEAHPEDFKYFHENDDGSVCAKIPLKWLKISYPKQISDEQRENASERFRKMRENGLLNRKVD